MDHWTSHAFHASGVSPRMMYADVTVGFADGYLTFSGRPLRSWRLWWWGGWLARFLLVVAAVVLAAPAVLEAGLPRGITSAFVITVAAIAGACLVALWAVRKTLGRLSRSSRQHSTERVVKLSLSDVGTVTLSGKTLSIRAPFDEANRSNRWRLRLDSHEQGESLMALLGRL